MAQISTPLVLRDFVVCSTVLGRQLARVDNFHGGACADLTDVVIDRSHG